jgi:hypothetical protein
MGDLRLLFQSFSNGFFCLQSLFDGSLFSASGLFSLSEGCGVLAGRSSLLSCSFPFSGPGRLN